MVRSGWPISSSGSTYLLLGMILIRCTIESF